MTIAASLLARVAAATVERARAEAALAIRYAPRFNPVELLGPGETRLSEVFRWLLDETETHGQGGIFRDRFAADLLQESPDKWFGARVAAEVPTTDGRGRIDLVMTSSDGAHCVVIENKPWAGWQAEQLSRYLTDQSARRDHVRVHALIGAEDAGRALQQHWAAYSSDPLPETVTACGYDAVAAWLDDCATLARAERVRGFLIDLADYCRRFILNEARMTEINDTAELILAGGEEALRAARSIAAALPLAMSRDVAARVGGSVEVVSNSPTIRVTTDGVAINFALFGHGNLWAGVTDKARMEQLRGVLPWGPSERAWPKWVYLRRAGQEGSALAEAVLGGDAETISQHIPAVARLLIGAPLVDAETDGASHINGFRP